MKCDKREIMFADQEGGGRQEKMAVGTKVQLKQRYDRYNRVCWLMRLMEMICNLFIIILFWE